MTTKTRVRFSVTEQELTFLETYQKEKDLKYLSDVLSALITEYQTLAQQLEQGKDIYQQALKIMRASARDAHLSLLLLNNASREFRHQVFNPYDSGMLKEAREYYQKELQAARTKKSHPKAETSQTQPLYVEDDPDLL